MNISNEDIERIKAGEEVTITVPAVTGHDKIVWEHSMLLLRAMGPVSFGQLKRELITQTPGVDASNAERVAREFVEAAKAQGAIEVDPEDGSIDLFYEVGR